MKTNTVSGLRSGPDAKLLDEIDMLNQMADTALVTAADFDCSAAEKRGYAAGIREAIISLERLKAEQADLKERTEWPK